jgi:hypothetical protein
MPICDGCRNVQERPDLPHVIRRCQGCGREMRIAAWGKPGKGASVLEGEAFVVPANWLKLSFNPLLSMGSLSRTGLDWFARAVFLEGVLSRSTFEEQMAAVEQGVDLLVDESAYIAPLHNNDPEHGERISDIIAKIPNTAEFWAYYTSFFLAWARDARKSGDATLASWSTACAERCRMMLLYKQYLEEVVWIGHSAKRVIDALNLWEGNRDNGDEQFWQQTFSANSYVLSQVFAVPVVFIQERAYMGGMRIDRQDGKFVDYLFSTESSREAILVEIKTPVGKLVGRGYRKNLYGPSTALAGAVVQVLDYRDKLGRNLDAITQGEPGRLNAFRPRCVLVVGNSKAELVDEAKKRSFELFRSNCGVEIVTYDELFRKVEILAELFDISRATFKIDGSSPRV